MDAQRSGDSQAQAPRALLRLVYIMGVVLVLLFLLLIGGIAWKASRGKSPATPAVEPRLELGIPAQDIRSTEIDGERLVITTAKEIIVVDVAKARVLLRMPLQGN
jgi:hypothetical protein